MRQFFEFGDFRLEPQNRRLTRTDGEVVSLTPKEFEVLVVLVEHRGDVVSKEALLDTVWKDAFVAEETMMRNISWLRKKLETGSDQGKIIETVPKFGYRLAVPVRQTGPAELIVEEQTVRRLVVEETVTIEDPAEVAGAKPQRLLLAAPTRRKRWWWAAVGMAVVAVIALSVYLVVFRHRSQPAVLAGKVSPFSGLPGRESMPAFSPDGRELAFAWNGGDGDSTDIYIKAIGAGEPLQLTKTAEAEIYPVFTPDGANVAFVRAFADHDDVIMVPALGGAERKLATLSSSRSSISFSPHGNVLAVVDHDPAQRLGGIVLVDLRTGERKALVKYSYENGDNTPRFSPDGSQVAFLTSFGDFIQEVMVVRADGTKLGRLTADKSRIYGLAWSQDGQQLLFVSQRVNGQRNLWRLPATGGEPQLISTGLTNLADLAVGPNGTIAITEDREDDNIWLLAPGKPDVRLIASSRADNSPHFSTDGSRIVFASDRTGDTEIWIADADGKNQRQLTDLKLAAGSPRFSPDGKAVAFDVQVDGSSDIFSIPAEGGQARRLTDDPARDALPSWSADGKWIFFVSKRDGALNLWKMPAEGGRAVQLTKQRGFESFAAPDGKIVYYTKGRDIAGLWQVPVDGGPETAVPELTDAGYWRYWAATNTGIYYLAHTGGPPYRVKFFDFSTRQTTDILSTDKTPLRILSGLAVSPDGQFILFAHSDEIGSSIMLTRL